MPTDSDDRRRAWLLFLIVLVGHGYFYNGAGANQNARLDTIYALVEPGPDGARGFRIDRFRHNTVDWAKAGDAFYSNKAPGTPLLGTPVYAALFHLERTAGVDPRRHRTAVWNAYAVNLFVSVFFTAVGVVALFALARKRGYVRGDATFVALAFAFGTLVFPYDTQLWGHSTAAAFLVVGHLALFSDRTRSLAGAGALLATAVVVDYIAALSLLPATGFLLARSDRRRALAWFTAGAAGPLLGLLVFQRACFGGWFTTAAAMTNPALEGSRFGLPSPAALLQLLVSEERGVLLHCPVLIVALPGLVRTWRCADRARSLTLAAQALGYVLFIAAYAGWHGGRATAARYLIPALPFWCLFLPHVSLLGRWPRRFVHGIAVWSTIQMLAIAAVDPMARSEQTLHGTILPRFLEGRFKARGGDFYLFRQLAPEDALDGVFNLGRLVGLRGLSSLAPLLAALLGLWIAFTWRPRTSANVQHRTVDRTRATRDAGIIRGERGLAFAHETDAPADTLPNGCIHIEARHEH